MDFFRSAPKTIYSLWVQGAASAPPLVQLCFKKWQALNPDYELKVLDGNDVVRLLGGTSIPIHAIPVQALSDIVRAKLLLETGGI